jgi:hypothetical protein
MNSARLSWRAIASAGAYRSTLAVAERLCRKTDRIDPTRVRRAAARPAGSESRFQLIDDTDVAGTIPYLPKG